MVSPLPDGSTDPMDATDIEAALQAAMRAVRKAARLLRRFRYDPPPAGAKPDGSVASALDRESERVMREVLHARHPDHAIVGEECPFQPGSGPFVWYLDPLDGTRAYSAGQDFCCAAATLTRNGVPLLTAVAAPFAGELYTAVRGRPSTVNGRPLRVAPARPVTQGELLLYYDAPEPGLAALYGIAGRGDLGRLTLLPGSFILKAGQTAKGAYDSLLCVKRRGDPLMAWDLAPAALVLGGAGGVLHDLEGHPIGGMIPAREVAAGRGENVGEILRLLGPRLRDPRPFLEWARRNEPVFARLISLVLARGGPCVIGIAGAGGGIGKTSFARELAELLGPCQSRIIALDDYLLPRVERDARGVGAHDPAASDLAAAAADLSRLRSGRTCTKPVYDHTQGRAETTEILSPVRFLLVEGVMALHPALRPLVDLGIFLDASPAVRYRRVARDREEKGLSEAYARAVHDRLEADCQQHLLPLREAADVVLTVDEIFGLRWTRPE